MRKTLNRFAAAAVIALSLALPAVSPAHAETTCFFNEIEVGLSHPPKDLSIGFCDAINITVNVSGIRPTISSPDPTLSTTDGRDADGAVLAGDFQPLRLGDGRIVRIARIVPLREGTADITFYNFDGSIRAMTKVTVKP